MITLKNKMIQRRKKISLKKELNLKKRLNHPSKKVCNTLSKLICSARISNGIKICKRILKLTTTSNPKMRSKK